MKKVLLGLMIVFSSVVSLWAKDTGPMWVSTVMNTTVEKVQDAAVDVFTAKSFVINDISSFKVEFQKTFNEPFAVVTHTVRINLIARDGNVRMMVTQMVGGVDAWGGPVYGQRGNLKHLEPLLKEIKYRVDGTPVSNIVNELQPQSAAEPDAPPKKELGLKLTDSLSKRGGYVIDNVLPDSLASESGLKAGDEILGVNLRPVNDMTANAILSFISARLSKGNNVAIEYLHNGKKDVTSIKSTR